MNITAFAQYAGVSKAAVSRYFNGGYLSAEKRAQIAAAVEATGYRPSMQAQMLRTRRTRQIGVIMPRLSSESCARMVEGISRVLDDQNYQLLLINTANNNTREVRALDTLRHIGGRHYPDCHHVYPGTPRGAAKPACAGGNSGAAVSRVQLCVPR